MNDEERILKEIKDVLKELDEQGRMKYTQKYMQHSDRTGGSLGVECQPQRTDQRCASA